MHRFSPILLFHNFKYNFKVYWVLIDKWYLTSGGFDQHVSFDEDELAGRPKDFVDFAQCNAGYAFPAAKMKWTNTVNGSVEKCDLGPTDMSGCEKDHDESGLL